MQTYIDRLCDCGYTRKEACSLCLQILREFGIYKLIAFVKDAEKYVDRV